MAILHPETFDLNSRSDGGLFREIAVIERLQQSLPSNYEIFHNVSYFSTHNNTNYHGEIDVIVMNPNGNLLIVEIKAGNIILRNGEIFKLYSGKEKSITHQTRTQYNALLNRLNSADLKPSVTKCLVLPDYEVTNTNLIEYPKDRIIGASDYDFLGTRIQEIFQASSRLEGVDAIRHFLKNEFKVTTNLSTLKGQVTTATKKLAEGMSTWVPRITSPSGVFRIQATAGSGKTQLAMQLLGNAAISKLKSLYVCFNRSLVDHISKIAPSNAMVTSFHELTIDHYRKIVAEPDFSDPEIFKKSEISYINHIQDQPAKYDLIIIDEAQDFEPDWVACFISQLKENGNLYFLEDEDQRLYERDGFDLDGAVQITSNENFRSPKIICELINALNLATIPIESKSPYQGELPEFRIYHNDKELIKQTSLALNSLMDKGFDLEDIVVLSNRGKQKSVILNQEKIGNFKTSHFTGQYNDNGEQIWSTGLLKTESIYRFKGQSCPAIILTEIDFAELSGLERKKLFVGLTRATMSIEIILSEQSNLQLSNMIN